MTYLLFTFMDFYPDGGIDDLAGHFSTSEEAMNAWTNDPLKKECAHVYCFETRKKVWETEFVDYDEEGNKLREWREVSEKSKGE